MKHESHPPMTIQPAKRLQKLPPYLFAEIDRMKRELIRQGKKVIDLGVGDPDLPTPDYVIEALTNAARDPVNHRYALDQGMPELRQAIAKWYQHRFSVTLDPETEILPLIGSKEGIAHMPLALMDPGEISLVPDPCYPVYKSSTWFAGGEPYVMPLLASNEFLPDFSDIPEDILQKSKLLFLNYPNNPTGAVAPLDFFKDVVPFARKHHLIVCHDAAYTEIAFDGFKPPSFLQVPGAKEAGIEFHSLSKTMNMTGWRVGFACGNRDAIQCLGKLKSNVDSGIFRAIQCAAVEALKHAEAEAARLSAIYQKRRDIVLNGFRSVGWKVNPLLATFYVWLPVPPGYTSKELCMKFLKDANVVVIPGNGFGANGEGYFRISLTSKEDQIEEAIQRITRMHR